MTNSSTKYEESVVKLGLLGPELRVGKASSPSGLRKFSLEHIRTLLRALDEPQHDMPAVLIAGTNGKGSTAATLASIANAAGLRTGLYTSPHLLRVNERMKISADDHSALAEIGDEAFGEIYLRVDAAATTLVEAGKLPHPPSFFEMLTAVALVWFAAQKVELAVLEVGLAWEGWTPPTSSIRWSA